MNSAVVCGVIAALCIVGTGSVAFAQAPGSERPFRALFGRGSQGAAGQSIDVSATLVEAYDDNLLAETGGISPGVAALSGAYSMLQAGGTYAWANERVHVGMTATSAFRYYGQVGDFQSVSHSGGIGLSTSLPKRTGLSLNQAVAYSPSYLSKLFPSLGDTRLGDAQPASPNYAVNDVTSYSYATTAALTHALTRRGSLQGVADYTFTDFRGGSLRHDGAVYGGRAEFSRAVGRHSAINAGYRYRTGDSGLSTQGKSTEHGIDIGIEHTKVLSASRNATFSFGVGSSRATVPPQPIAAAPSQAGSVALNLYRLTADGAFAYQFSRTGKVSASYRRGVEYIVQLAQPVFIDGVSVSGGGLLADRVELTMGAGYSTGASALQQASSFNTYTADIRTRMPLTRMLAVSVEYLYYFYDFGSNTLLAPNLPRRLARNGVRAGLTLSTPFLRR
jgi:hypothetical protein